MQGRGNGQGRIWLLSGTGEGPPLAATLLRHGWRVEVSVVTSSAARAYAGLDLDRIAVGPLQGEEAIEAALKGGDVFRWVIDATHPFAVRISTDLARACAECRQPLLRLQRPLEHGGAVQLLNQIGDLAGIDLNGRRLLLALGGRHLPAVHSAAVAVGAEVYARCLPSADGLRAALAAGLPPDQLAVVRPLQGACAGAIERALCRRWRITDVICRQSGGVTERLWRGLSADLDLRLLMLRRPDSPAGVETVESEVSLMKRIQSPQRPCADG